MNKMGLISSEFTLQCEVALRQHCKTCIQNPLHWGKMCGFQINEYLNKYKYSLMNE